MAEIRTGAEVTSISADGRSGEVVYEDSSGRTHRVAARWLLSGVAPRVLANLQGDTPPERPEGAQLKINLLVRHLPRLRSLTPAPFFGSNHDGTVPRSLGNGPVVVFSG